VLTNNPAKYGGLAGYGLTVEERVPTPVVTTPENVDYLRTKRDRMGHLIDIPDTGRDTGPDTTRDTTRGGVPA
jgi:3,4-dihydroxy 2-butanone 4-phosphate synthase/GTP cyclohydrolase II